MKLSDTWGDFISKLDRIAPRVGETMMLQFDKEPDQRDEGSGF